jgi:hypothetical protein
VSCSFVNCGVDPAEGVHVCTVNMAMRLKLCCSVCCLGRDMKVSVSVAPAVWHVVSRVLHPSRVP